VAQANGWSAEGLDQRRPQRFKPLDEAAGECESFHRRWPADASGGLEVVADHAVEGGPHDVADIERVLSQVPEPTVGSTRTGEEAEGGADWCRGDVRDPCLKGSPEVVTRGTAEFGEQAEESVQGTTGGEVCHGPEERSVKVGTRLDGSHGYVFDDAYLAAGSDVDRQFTGGESNTSKEA